MLTRLLIGIPLALLIAVLTMVSGMPVWLELLTVFCLGWLLGGDEEE